VIGRDVDRLAGEGSGLTITLWLLAGVGCTALVVSYSSRTEEPGQDQRPAFSW